MFFQPAEGVSRHADVRHNQSCAKFDCPTFSQIARKPTQRLRHSETCGCVRSKGSNDLLSSQQRSLIQALACTCCSMQKVHGSPVNLTKRLQKGAGHCWAVFTRNPPEPPLNCSLSRCGDLIAGLLSPGPSFATPPLTKRVRGTSDETLQGFGAPCVDTGSFCQLCPFRQCSEKLLSDLAALQTLENQPWCCPYCAIEYFAGCAFIQIYYHYASLRALSAAHPQPNIQKAQ